MKIPRTDFDRFQEYGCLISSRIVYFGSEREDEEGEKGVDSYSSKKAIKNLLFLDHLNQKQIILYINNPGGCWYNGMALYDTIRRIKSPVKAIGTGQVMSMGTIIIQACRYRCLTKDCTFMIHDGYEGVYADSKTFEAWGDWAKHLRKRMYEIYYKGMVKKNKHLTLKHIEVMCSHDKIMTADEAVKLGLADKVI
jgi:ATP-dependent Clp protease protease subunit